MRWMAAALMMGWASLGGAASIGTTGSGDSAMILITGELVQGDAARFTEAALSQRDATVVLASPGGSLQAGIDIGEAARLLDMRTMVPDDAVCASACALAWLGGTRRVMGNGAQIGFHAAYRVTEQGGASVSSMGNALVGGYLNKLGLSDQAIFYITRSDPAAMQWLSEEDALRLGISVQKSGAAVAGTQSLGTPAPGPVEPRVTWAVKPYVSKGYQNIRSGPGTMHPVVFRIPAREGGITVTQCRRPDPGGGRYDWCYVTWRGQSGWSSINGLEQDIGR